MKLAVIFILIVGILGHCATEARRRRSGLRCWTCDNAASNEECIERGKSQRCRPNQSTCQNQVRTYADGRLSITKRCKQANACENDRSQDRYQAQCNLERQGSNCICCCNKGLDCNKQTLNCTTPVHDPPIACTSAISTYIPANGVPPICTNTNNFGSACTFGCVHGHVLSDTAPVTCSGTADSFNGVWNTAAPKCSITSCASPSDMTGSTFHCDGDVNYGGTCELTCAVGYTGARTLNCNQHTSNSAISTWDDDSACTLTSCTSPSDVAGSTFNCVGEIKFGGSCELICADGYTGTGTLTCNQHTPGAATSTWDDDSACKRTEPILNCHVMASDKRRRRRRSLDNIYNYVAFVIDDTGSMGDEMVGAKQWLSNCVNTGESCGSLPTGGMVLQSFNDPGVGTPYGPTTNAGLIDAQIGLLRAHGGGDCPELAFSGVISAVSRIPELNTNCKVYMFTDATPKDPERAGEALDALKKKGCQFIPVLTGCCGGSCSSTTSDPFERLYYDMADNTGGTVYILNNPSTPAAFATSLADTIGTLGFCPTDIMVNNLDGSCMSQTNCFAGGHCFDEAVNVCYENA